MKLIFQFDFKSVSQLLRENDVILHVLSENAFSVKKVIGVDSTKAFIRKDQIKLGGSEELRKQVTPIKSVGQCGSLALNTEGSVFSTFNNNKKNQNDYKTVANVFAKRLVQHTKPKPCHICECEGNNSGAAFLTCTSCEHQSNSDYVSFAQLCYKIPNLN